MGLEPLLPCLIFGHAALHKFPEAGGMVEFDQVAELMDHHIFQRLRRSHDQLPVEIEVIQAGAAAPFGPLLAQCDAVRAHADLRGEISHPLLKVIPRTTVGDSTENAVCKLLSVVGIGSRGCCYQAVRRTV